MKKLTYFLVLTVISSSLLFQSCKKDKDLPNELTFNGQTVSLDKGFIESYGANGDGSYDYDVTLVSSGINYDFTEEDLIGQGNVLYLDLNTSSASGLVAGTYNYAANRAAFTMVDGVVGVNINTQSTQGGWEIVSGSVDISTEGNVVTISYDLVASNNSAVTGQFKGTLSPI